MKKRQVSSEVVNLSALTGKYSIALLGKVSSASVSSDLKALYKSVIIIIIIISWKLKYFGHVSCYTRWKKDIMLSPVSVVGIPATMIHIQPDYGPMHYSENSGKSLVWLPEGYMDQIKKLTRFAFGLTRHELKLLVGLLTGHITLNRHLL